MPTYITPGVYIEEISKTPLSIKGVETSIPVFIGFTDKTKDENNHSLLNVPTRLKSLSEFEKVFGTAQNQEINVNVQQTRLKESGKIVDTKVYFSEDLEIKNDFVPKKMLHYAMEMFFSNGGGPCYVVSIGGYGKNVAPDLFINVFPVLEGFDEPTLLIFPDACLCDSNDYGNVINAALAHCQKMGDRFAIIDVPNAVSGGTLSDIDVTKNFRDRITRDMNLLKYGAAYFPYLRTGIPAYLNDERVTIKEHNVVSLMAYSTIRSDEKGIFEGKKLNGKDAVGKYLKEKDAFTYNKVKNFLSDAKITMPPSPAIAGAYVRVDSSKGVWKAPANVSLSCVIEPAIQITNNLGQKLNVDTTSGKSINAIRTFSGRGTRVWGARTLAGNDNENRYVSVRRFLNFIEESIKKALIPFGYESNDANTWKNVQSMIQNFLSLQWKNGALQGAKPEDGFYVRVGQNKTMSVQDVLDGRMIVEIGLAMVRPGEFISLRIIQMITK